MAAGLPENYLDLVKGWAAAEEAYAALGYRPIDLHAFTQAGGFGASLTHLLRQKLQQGETPVYHAKEHLEEMRKAPETQ